MFYIGKHSWTLSPWFICTWLPIIIFSSSCSVSQIPFSVLFSALFFFSYKPYFFFIPRKSHKFSYTLTAWHIHSSRALCSVTCPLGPVLDKRSFPKGTENRRVGRPETGKYQKRSGRRRWTWRLRGDNWTGACLGERELGKSELFICSHHYWQENIHFPS